jgi:hypothetical protein
LASAWRGSYDAIVLYLPSRPYYEWALAQSDASVIYDRVVDWSTAPSSFRAPRDWRQVEQAILESVRCRSSWTAVTDHPSLTQDMRSRGIPAETVLPAADEEFLSAAPSVKRPVAGYFGAIRDEVDTQFLSTLSTACPVEIIGPVPERPRKSLAQSGALLRPPMDLSSLVREVGTWNVVLLPYRGSRTSSLSPAKLFNSLALGSHVAVRGISMPGGLERAVIQLEPNDEMAVHQVSQLLTRPARRPDFPLPTWAERWRELSGHGGFG